MARFETEVYTTADLFSSRFVFEFPDYQRPYRWTGQQVNQLLDDLLTASGIRENSHPDQSYFLGGIVVVSKDKRRRSVIDGKQRLTTLAIMLAVLRDLERNPAHKSGIHACLADEADPVAGIQRGYRIVLGEPENAAFKEWVFENGATQKNAPSDDETLHERDYEAIRQARTLWARLNPVSPENCKKLVNYILHHVELVTITAADEDQGDRIFRVLNARGLDLSEADAIKPEILASLSEQEREEVSGAWEEWDGRLGNQGMEELLRCLIFIHNGKDRAFLKSYRTQFLQVAKTAGIRRVAVEELGGHGDAVWRLRRHRLNYDNDEANGNVVVQGLDWLPWDSRDWAFVAAHIVAKTEDDPKRQYDLLRGLDRCCYVSVILDEHEDTRRTIFEKTVLEIDSGIDPLTGNGSFVIFQNTASKVKARLPEPFHNSRQRVSLVRRIEVALSRQKVHFDIGNSTLEHVLPKNPANGASWTVAFDKRARSALTHTLGNFALLSRGLGKQIGNRPFSEKKRAIFLQDKKPYAITRDLNNYTDWTPGIVRARTKRLADLLLQDLGII